MRGHNADGFTWCLILRRTSGHISYSIWETSSWDFLYKWGCSSIMFSHVNLEVCWFPPHRDSEKSLSINIFCYNISVHSFTASQSPLHLSPFPSNILLLVLSLIQTSLKLAMLLLIITVSKSKPGTFRNRRRPQDGNLRGCSLLTISFKLAEKKCIVSSISPTWTELCWFSTNFP